ncbi:non-hydrolyzing UDP-N-acetylglucosamine 2-epimerase [Natronococcus wangiae]|uniref:non-hydrolyzing UDP-N-acetylglucosamine 2-epimerase n=1 Tax=Natronococcus wangiae TaxID=3068275 RepID=UPI00273FF2A6|nr:UDP-N-acetylglucosamine 2-epimerase (non-hydrolyzing) [Natronococcus sp. AD5]
MSKLRIAFVLGTRPEIIKLSPIIRECRNQAIPHIIIHTGQHYSESLDSVFFDQLELPAPDYNLKAGSQSHGKQTAEMITGIEKILRKESPEHVLVQGDTNSVLAGVIAASKLEMTLGHVEAGLRSFDRNMPEEVNRVLADHASDYLFPPTDQSARLLEAEGITGDHVVVTGNTIVDAVYQNVDLAEQKSTVLEQYDLEPDEFYLLTAHRAENVDDRDRFSGILQGVNELAAQTNLDAIYPIHPRAQQNIEEFGLDIPDRIQLIEPLDFLDFLYLENNSRLIFTDSGGVQEEASILQTPCVTLRDNTERPETIDVGANQLVGTDPSGIVNGATVMMTRSQDWSNPFGDGTAATTILDVIL